MIKNVNPNIEMIISIDIQMTASIEYADLALPANSWLEFEDVEVTASCRRPGGCRPSTPAGRGSTP